MARPCEKQAPGCTAGGLLSNRDAYSLDSRRMTRKPARKVARQTRISSPAGTPGKTLSTEASMKPRMTR